MIIKLQASSTFNVAGVKQPLHVIAVESIDRASFGSLYSSDANGNNTEHPYVDLLISGKETRVFGEHREAVEKALEFIHEVFGT